MVEYPVKNVKLYNNGDKDGTLSPVDFYYITQHHNRESLKTLRNPIIKRWNKKGYLIHRKSYKYQNYLPLWIYVPHLLERQEHNYRDAFPHTETKWYKYQIADREIKYKDTFFVNLWDIIIYEHFSLQEFIYTDEWKKKGETTSVSYMDLRDKIKTRISVSIVESGHSYNVESNVWSKAYLGLKNLEIVEKEIWNTYSGGNKAFESQTFTWEFKYKESENTDTYIYWKSDNWYKLQTKEQEYILLKIEQENKLPLQRWVKREMASQQPWYSEIIVVSDPIGWVKYVIVDKVDNYNDIIPTTEWIKDTIAYYWGWYQDTITPSLPLPDRFIKTFTKEWYGDYSSSQPSHVIKLPEINIDEQLKISTNGTYNIRLKLINIKIEGLYGQYQGSNPDTMNVGFNYTFFRTTTYVTDQNILIDPYTHDYELASNEIVTDITGATNSEIHFRVWFANLNIFNMRYAQHYIRITNGKLTFTIQVETYK